MTRLARAALLLALVGGCVHGGPDGQAVDITTPTAEVYPDGASDFTGAWVGESAGVFGSLEVERLDPDRYYGRFTSQDGLVRFVCNMRQVQVAPEPGGAMTPGNLVVFTWQDGRGGRGQGWVLINRENSALSGEIRHGGAAAWDFVRAEDPHEGAVATADEPPKPGLWGMFIGT